MQLQKWRKRRGLSQKNLGERCQVSRSLICLIETGRMKAYPGIKKKIAHALGVQETDIKWPR